MKSVLVFLFASAISISSFAENYVCGDVSDKTSGVVYNTNKLSLKIINNGLIYETGYCKDVNPTIVSDFSGLRLVSYKHLTQCTYVNVYKEPSLSGSLVQSSPSGYAGMFGANINIDLTPGKLGTVSIVAPKLGINLNMTVDCQNQIAACPNYLQ